MMIKIQGSLFNTILKKAGYTVFSAKDGAEALDVMDREHIDLVLLDIMMPNIDLSKE